MSSVITTLQLILPPRPTRTKSLCSLKNTKQGQQQEHELSSSSSSNSFLPNLISFALALSLTSSSSPALAIPSLSSSQPQTTPFYPIQVCSDRSSQWKLKEAIVSTQKNPKFVVLEDTPYGRYLEAEVEGGGFNRDVMEFLVKQDVVAYRCMTTKVTFVYPFTTAFGDSKGQEERMKMLIDQLGWFALTFESME